MKLTFLIALCWMFGGMLPAQSIEEDAVLMGLKDLMPENWNMEFREGNLVVECRDSIWLVFQNKINMAPGAKIQGPKEGERPNAVSRFIFHVEPKWDAAKKAKAEAENTENAKKLADLEAKHDVASCKKVSKGRTIYVPQTDADKKKITAFHMEEREVLSGMNAFPDYQTEKYALFKLSATGMESEYDNVFPEETNRQMYKIADYLNQNAKP